MPSRSQGCLLTSSLGVSAWLWLALSSGDELLGVSQAVWRNRATARQELARVLERG